MIQATAPAPVRSTTSFTLSFGLLNIPLSVYTGTESTRVSRKEFFNGDPTIEVGRSPIRKDTGEVIHQTDVVRMAQADSGAWVTLTDEEIAACTSPRGVAEVVAFVPVKEVGQYLTENVQQVRPKSEKGKVNPAADRAFGLLTTAMAKRKVMALVKVAMRGPARYALLDAKGNLFLVYTADAVRETVALNEHKFDAKEVDLAMSLIDAVGVSAPLLTDDTAPMVQSFVNDKATGVEPTKAVAPAAVGVDMMAQLLASLEAAKAG